MRKKRILTGFASIVSFMLIVAILGMNCMMDYAGTVNGALGIVTSKVVNDGDASADTTYYESEYGELNSENLQKLIQDTYEESVLEEEEGAVLLKNENNALPLNSAETKVTLFGHAVAQPVYKPSSAGSKGYKGEHCISLYKALENAGFSINDQLFDAYVASPTSRGTGAFDFMTQTTSVFSLGEEKIDFYTENIRNSWENDYNDVAIVMLAREGGEGTELLTKDEEGISQLALHQDEKDMLQMIKDSGTFTKTIVLINSGWAMELEWLEEYEVDAALWIGCPGQRGFEGVANLLTGKANPSGSLTSTYAVNSLSAPAVVNGSYNNQSWANLEEVLATTTEGDADVSWYTVQAEGIYVGYKYYETRYEDLILNKGNAGASVGSSTQEPWNYTAEVSYPFGYGMSYTSFEQTLDRVQIKGEEIEVTVTVTNTGTEAGKKSVQIYAQTPYGDYEKQNKVEKSAIQLLDFGKTKLLNPGESETVTILCDKYLLASYDYTKEKGYMLSEGQYYIAVGENAHDALNNVLAAKGAAGMVDVLGNTTMANATNAYSWEENFDANTYNNSQYTGEEVTNQFADADINYWEKDAVTYLSRNDWEKTYPVNPTIVEASEEMIEILNGDYYVKAEDGTSVSDYTVGENQDIPLASLIGATYDDELWETYLNQFTVEELSTLLADNFGTAEIASTGKPAVKVGDGPDGVGGVFNEKLYGDGRDDTCFPCELILASTFNKDLMTRRGELMGEESLYLGMATVWMPGGNIHRTPFGGRNFEYYSEDAVMNYLCEIPEIKAMEAKGVHAGIKHLVGNDQENNRMGISVFFNEQAFRETSLKAFEGALAVAGGQAVMHGFNRLGPVWCSSSTILCTQIVENEWGFQGQQETDAVASGEPYKVHYATSLMAGTDTYCLDFAGSSSLSIAKQIRETDDGDLLAKLREAAHDYLYTIANSSVMNGYSADSKVVSITPWWQFVMYTLIAVFALLDILLIAQMIRKKEQTIIAIEEAE